VIQIVYELPPPPPPPENKNDHCVWVSVCSCELSSALEIVLYAVLHSASWFQVIFEKPTFVVSYDPKTWFGFLPVKHFYRYFVWTRFLITIHIYIFFFGNHVCTQFSCSDVV
jgi:hypothetical protein